MTNHKGCFSKETKKKNNILGWYNEPLPKLPLPTLEHTLERYMEYVEVLCNSDAEALRETKKAIRSLQFDESELHQQLDEVAKTSDNWAKKFWLPAFYLKDRNPLPMYASPAYVLPQRNFRHIDEFFSYVSWLILGFCEYKTQIERKQIPRDFSREGKRMCMEQYDLIFSSYREPQINEDILYYKRSKNSSTTLDEHILVMCRNQAYILFTHLKGQLLSYRCIKQQLEKIEILSRDQSEQMIKLIGAGSIGYRTDAALFWSNLRSNSENEQNFQLAKNASFVICLDICENHQNISDEISPVNRGKQVICGFSSLKFGLNRWYDATLQIIISTNGTNGICIEHSVAEGIIIFTIVDAVLQYVNTNITANPVLDMDDIVLSPQPLTWQFDSTSFKLLEKQIHDFDKVANDIDLYVLHFKDFGKNYIKSLKVSPDGFVQLAMQLAAYRWFGKTVSTYESASLRTFAGGRVDNIRASTLEAFRWVRAMTDSSVPEDIKKELFIKAAKKQAVITHENITGLGIDNHLIALFELSNLLVANSKRTDLPDIFSNSTWTRIMQFPLSTSQATQSTLFSDRFNFYGPMDKNGYGIPYNIQENYIVFSISAYRSSKDTDPKAFGETIKTALLELRDLVV